MEKNIINIAIIDAANISDQTSEKFSSVYDVPIIGAVIVVQTDAPKKRKTFMAETDVPEMAVGYHSFTWVKDSVMNPPENPKMKHIAIQNQ